MIPCWSARERPWPQLFIPNSAKTSGCMRRFWSWSAVGPVNPFTTEVTKDTKDYCFFMVFLCALGGEKPLFACAILSLMAQTPEKTFYIETFGCQMNVHDSEKVIGTLLAQGYRKVESVQEAGLILYNTCSIRDKAEQKVFHRLADFKKLAQQGKKFGVLGCVAQQEGEKIFERAPHVSLVCGSASYNKLPGMLVQLEGKSGAVEPDTPRAPGENGALRDDASETATTAGNFYLQKSGSADLVRITGLDDRQTDKCFETEFTARTNPHRGYITIIEGCDKFCAYCVVPFTRGKERSRTSAS